MKRKILLGLFIFLILFTITGCGNNTKKDNKYALEFKEEYESLNGVKNKNGKNHRTIAIAEDNPYVKTTPDKILDMIENDETFFLYVGDPLCPWCRSVLEKSIKVAKEYDIEKIYYIDIWDEDGNEILRDKYEIQDDKAVKVQNGTDAYYELLKSFDTVLSNYTLTSADGTKIETGEKRIYAPNYFYIKDGTVIKMVSGISELQSNPMEELTEEMLEDEEKQFESLFELGSICSDNGC